MEQTHGQNNKLDTTMVEFHNLPHPPELNQALLQQLDTHIRGHWSASFQCITVIRSICKVYPQYIPDIFSKYGPTILDLFNQSTPLLLKNILKLLAEVFSHGLEVNLQGCVSAFLPLLSKKAALQTGQIKQTSQEILTIIASKCGYCNTIQITTELSCDKNSQISQLAIKLLSGIISNVGANLTLINPHTLQHLMKGMSALINGKRNNMKNGALDICIFIYNQIGSQNYLQLMNYSLGQDEVVNMGQAMQTHRVQKNKGPQFADVMRQYKSQRMSGSYSQNLRM